MAKPILANIEEIVHEFIQKGSLFFNKKSFFRNLEKMESGEFSGVLCNESIGGNAGISHSCVNFWFDEKTGEIRYFENNGEKKLADLNGLRKGGYLCLLTKRESLIEKIVVDDDLLLEPFLTLAYSAYQFNMRHAVYAGKL